MALPIRKDSTVSNASTASSEGQLFTRTFMTLVERSPTLRRGMWRLTYNMLAKFRRRDEFEFMNYGYAETDPKFKTQLEPQDEPWRLVSDLYERAVRGLDLEGKSVLEVGSGRGGGAAYLTKYHKPKSYIGVDIAKNNVKFCNARHNLRGLSFQTGDAEALDFPDNFFDFVVNIESSHCYGSFEKFVREVHRVLKPGGTFAFSDLRGERSFGINTSGLMEIFKRVGFSILEFTDITKEVVVALEILNNSKEQFLGERFPKLIQKPVADLIGTGGTRFFEELKNGEAQYVAAQFRK